MRTPKVIRAGSCKACLLCYSQGAVQFVCGPDLAVTCCVEIDGVGYALEFAVLGGVVVVEVVRLVVVGEGFEAIGPEGAAFSVEDVSLDEARPKVVNSYCF